MPHRIRKRAAQIALTLALLPLLATLGGCELAAVMAASHERYGSHVVPAEYRGLEGHSYAVIVQADRDVVAENPNLLEHMIAQINSRLAEFSGASGHVPTDQLILYLMNNTRWPAMSNAELAKEIGDVERLIVVDLADYRLTEPNNDYVWEGLAQGRVIVFEADGQGGGEVMFEREIRVTYPDISGVTPEDQPRETVTSVLARRMADRVVWLFHDHEELISITY